MKTRSAFRTFGLFTIVNCGFLAVAGSRVDADDELRWKFTPNNEVKYVLTESTSSSTKLGEQSFDATHDMTLDIVRRVKDVKDGQATVVQRFTRARVKMNGPRGAVDFDTDSGKVPTGPVADSMLKPLQSAINADFVATLDARGKVYDVVVPEAFRKQSNSPGSTLFSVDNMSQMFSFLPFPEEAVAAGHKWSHEHKSGVPGGALHITVAAVYKGKDETNAGLERIDLRLVSSFKKEDNAPVEIKIKSEEATGFLLFDNASGQLVQSSITQKFVMEVKAQGTTFLNSIERQADLRLAPPADKSDGAAKGN